MKILPKIYAKTLIDTANANNVKKIAANFWYKLQKNKQYKDLPKVLEMIDEEAAEAENKILVKIYSKNALSVTETETISKNLEKKFNKVIISEKQVPSVSRKQTSFILQNHIGKDITGTVVKVGDKIIDMSLENKINKLKKQLKA